MLTYVVFLCLWDPLYMFTRLTWKEMAFPFGRWELASFNRLSLMLMVTVDFMWHILLSATQEHVAPQLLSKLTLACLIKIIIAVCWFSLVDLISLFGLILFSILLYWCWWQVKDFWVMPLSLVFGRIFLCLLSIIRTHGPWFIIVFVSGPIWCVIWLN